MPTSIDDETLYEIDGAIPYVQFNRFTSTSSVCEISTYEIYRTKEDTEQHPEFQPAELVSAGARGVVRFHLQEEVLGSFNYYIKVVANGGNTYWSTLKLFETQCSD